MKKLLFITPDPPLPPLGGGTRSYHVLKAFSSIGKVDLVVFRSLSEQNKTVLNPLCHSITTIDKDHIEQPKTPVKKIYHSIKYILPFLFNANSLNRELDTLVNHWQYKLPLPLTILIFYWFKFWLTFKSPLPLKTLGREKNFKKLKDSLTQVLQTTNYTHIILDFSYIYPLVKDVLPHNVKIITNSHNIEYSFYDQLIKQENNALKIKFLNYQKSILKKWEMIGYAQSNLIFCCSEVDKQIIDNKINNSDKTHIIPNGVDCEYFTPNEKLTSYPSLLFTGTFGYQPNNDAMEYFINEIFPEVKKQIPDIRLIIAGRNADAHLKKYKHDTCIDIIDSPDDMRPLFNKAWIYIVPLRHGSGTRLKILEAWSMYKAVISTPIGIEGIDYKNQLNCLLAISKEDWLVHILTIVNNNTTRNFLEQNAKKAVKKYNWVDIEKKIIYNL